jgi:hypothetical protein
VTVNDRLYDELLKPVADDFFRACQALSVIEPTTDTAVSRSFLHGRMAALEEAGNRIADVLNVPEPLWADMRAVAGTVTA